jgi:hypothetical protein
MFLKQSTAYTFRFGPFLDDTDGKTAETGLTIEDSHVRVSKAGANFIDKAETSTSAHDEAGFYVVVLNTTDTNTVGELLIAAHISGALPVFKTFQVVEEAIYDAIYGGSADLITKVDAIDTVVDAILVDTGTTLPATLDTIDNFLDTEVAAILADTNELQADWVNGGRLDLLIDSIISKVDVVDGIVDSILVDTAEIGAAGAGLTAVWTTAITESYAADGAAATPAQLMYMVWCAVHEFSISSTTITGKKIDGSTTAMTWTLDDATSPTSRTRAS